LSSHQQMPRKAACHRPYHRRPSRLQGRLPPSERSPQPRRECSRRPQQVRNRPSQLRHGEAPGRACRHLMRGARRPPFGGGGGGRPDQDAMSAQRAVATMGALQDSRSLRHGQCTVALRPRSKEAHPLAWQGAGTYTPCHQHRCTSRAQHRLHGHTVPQKLESRCERTPHESRRRRFTTRCDCTLARSEISGLARCVRGRRATLRRSLVIRM